MGQFKDGQKHGKGKIDLASGDCYTGDWSDDKVTGQGVYVWSNGNCYELIRSAISDGNSLFLSLSLYLHTGNK